MFHLQIVVNAGADATPPAPKTVTYDDNGKTITLRVGEQFLLKLGDSYTWTITVDDPSVVSRVINIAVVRGAQGVYEAKKTGATTLTANGLIVCQKLQVCPQSEIHFSAQLIVQ